METTPINTGQLIGGGTIKAKCKQCGAECTFNIPRYEVINASSVSMIVFSHTDPQLCEACGKPHQFVIGGVEKVACGFVGLKHDPRTIIEQRNRIILPD